MLKGFFNALRSLLGGWALIPCIPLMAIGYVLAGVVAMASDDFQREPTGAELAVIATGFLPMVWFAAILGRLAWKAGRRFHNHQ